MRMRIWMRIVRTRLGIMKEFHMAWGLREFPNLGTTVVFGRDLLDDPHQDITVQVVENPVFRPRLF